MLCESRWWVVGGTLVGASVWPTPHEKRFLVIMWQSHCNLNQENQDNSMNTWPSTKPNLAFYLWVFVLHIHIVVPFPTKTGYISKNMFGIVLVYPTPWCCSTQCKCLSLWMQCLNFFKGKLISLLSSNVTYPRQGNNMNRNRK